MLTSRPIEDGDEPFLRQLFESVRGDDFASLPLPEAQKASLLDMQFKAQKAQYRSRYPNAAFDLLLLQDSPVGSITVDRDELEIRLVDISLLPAYRGQGHGARLIQGLIQESREGSKTLALHVARTNRARRLYERLGFLAMEDDGMYVHMRFGTSSNIDENLNTY